MDIFIDNTMFFGLIAVISSSLSHFLFFFYSKSKTVQHSKQVRSQMNDIWLESEIIIWKCAHHTVFDKKVRLKKVMFKNNFREKRISDDAFDYLNVSSKFYNTIGTGHNTRCFWQILFSMAWHSPQGLTSRT